MQKKPSDSGTLRIQVFFVLYVEGFSYIKKKKIIFNVSLGIKE